MEVASFMTRENYIKELIKGSGLSIKDFAQEIQMPYSTLLTMLNNEKLGAAAIDSVIKICQGLSITIEDLQSAQDIDLAPTDKLVLSPHERNLILNYREKKDLQKAIDILLFSDK